MDQSTVINIANIEVMRCHLKRYWIEDFYAFCDKLGGTTAEVMGHLLKVIILSSRLRQISEQYYSHSTLLA